MNKHPDESDALRPAVGASRQEEQLMVCRSEHLELLTGAGWRFKEHFEEEEPHFTSATIHDQYGAATSSDHPSIALRHRKFLLVRTVEVDRQERIIDLNQQLKREREERESERVKLEKDWKGMKAELEGCRLRSQGYADDLKKLRDIRDQLEADLGGVRKELGDREFKRIIEAKT